MDPLVPGASLTPTQQTMQPLAPQPALNAGVQAPKITPPVQTAPQPQVSPDMQQQFDKNQQYLAQGDHTYNTQLSPQEETQFRQWLEANKVPFDPNALVSDYDMRGFWKALQANDPKAKSAIDPNDKQLHYPDYWKTPYHQTFSSESQWAGKSAPKWNAQDQLIAPDGSVLFDDRAGKPPQPVNYVTDGQGTS